MIEVKLDDLTFKVDGEGDHKHFEVNRAILLIDDMEVDVSELIDSVNFYAGGMPAKNQNNFGRMLGRLASNNYTETQNEIDEDAAFENHRQCKENNGKIY